MKNKASDSEEQQHLAMSTVHTARRMLLSSTLARLIDGSSYTNRYLQTVCQ